MSRSNFFGEEWRKCFWAPNYAGLLALRDGYDPADLFFGRHSVGG
jgi:hypothetical protein